MEEVQLFLKENVRPDEYIVVGVSGGVDSMVLLKLLTGVSNNIICAHIHHNQRLESDEEEAFVKSYCKKENILFESIKLEYADKFSENTAREQRYVFFEDMLQKYGSKTLLTAHHGDDLIETIMMRLVRGASLKGYGGIEQISKRENYVILRPLLCLNKEEIYAYANANTLAFREDKSNEEETYTRNRYRKCILPFLKEEAPEVHAKFMDYSKTILEAAKYIDQEVSAKYATVVGDKIDLDKFLQEEPFIQKELLHKYLFAVYQDEIDKIGNNHIQILMDLIQTGEANTTIDLPGGYQATKEYQTFVIALTKEIEGYSFNFAEKQELPNKKTIKQLTESDDTSNFTAYLDSGEVELPLTIRTLAEGDKMTVKNMDGHKKISDIFTDEKVPMMERLLWPIVVDNAGQIIWLPGLKKSHFDKKKTEKYDIILGYY
jgi:tRNA(Ile)-lysidine synthase